MTSLGLPTKEQGLINVKLFALGIAIRCLYRVQIVQVI